MAKEKLQLFFKKTGESLQKNAPQIAIWAGVLGLAGAGVWACVKTIKFKEKTQEHFEEFKAIKERKEFDITDNKQYRSEWLKEVCRMGWTCIKLYWAPATLAVVSGTGIILGKKKLVKRWQVSTQVAAGTKAMFDSYRERVAARIGEEAEKEIFNGVKDVKYTEEKLDKKTGETKEITKKGKELADPDNLYSFKFNITNFPHGFEKNIEYNVMNLENQMASWNTIGRARAIVDHITDETIEPGKVSLYEVLDNCGFDWHRKFDTKEEQKKFEELKDQYKIVGWKLTHNPDEKMEGIGDNVIDFGITLDHDGMFINPWEDAIRLNFNCDGIILFN